MLIFLRISYLVDRLIITLFENALSAFISNLEVSDRISPLLLTYYLKRTWPLKIISSPFSGSDWLCKIPVYFSKMKCQKSFLSNPHPLIRSTDITTTCKIALFLSYAIFSVIVIFGGKARTLCTNLTQNKCIICQKKNLLLWRGKFSWSVPRKSKSVNQLGRKFSYSSTRLFL